MRRLSSALLLAAACSRPDPLVLCHNANCTGKLVVHRDDTLDALRASLQVDVDGRPAWDGIEIDTVWHGAQERCTFAHQVRDNAPDAEEAGALIADHLLAAPAPSWNGSLFVLKIELKPVVGPDLEQHDGTQERQHADCVLDLVDTVAAAAAAANVDLEVIADSSDDGLLREVARRPRWLAIPRRRLSADFGAPRPFTPDTPKLSELAGVPLDLIEFHPGWLTDADVEAFRSLDVDFVLWMFSATPELLAAIRTYDPEYVNTGEAELMRRWIER
jgi:hypothetical protein